MASAFARMDETDPPFDVLHDHCGFTAFAFADRIDTPWCTRCTGRSPTTRARSTRATRTRRARSRSAATRPSRRPTRLEVVAVIGNPIVVGDFPFRADKDDYLLWIGRFNDDKGPHRAIAVAREAELPLVLAGPVQPGSEEFFEREVEPHLDGERVRYVGEVGEEKGDLYAGARALLMPIRWPEPFGLVMTEAMACGTPVIAFPEGSAPELVLDGETGFVVDDEHGHGGRGRAARARSTRRAAATARGSASTWPPWPRPTRAPTRPWPRGHAHPFVDSASKGGSLLPPEESAWRTSTARAAG